MDFNLGFQVYYLDAFIELLVTIQLKTNYQRTVGPVLHKIVKYAILSGKPFITPFIALHSPVALLPFSASHIISFSDNFHKIFVSVNWFDKHFFRQIVMTKSGGFSSLLHCYSVLVLTLHVFSREPLLSLKDLCSSQDIFWRGNFLLPSNHNIWAATVSASACNWPGRHICPM